MLIGSAGAMVGALLMFLQGGFYLYEAWHTLMTPGEAVERQVTVPVLEAVDAFLFGIVLVIFAYGIAIGFVPRIRATLGPTVGLVAVIPPLALLPILFITLGPGEAALVIGPNGAGKSSLLRIAAGLLRPAAGEVHSAGVAPSRLQ